MYTADFCLAACACSNARAAFQHAAQTALASDSDSDSEQHDEETAANPPDSSRTKLCITLRSRETSYPYSVWANDPLGKLMTHHAAQIDAAPASIRLLFDGMRILETQTPDDVRAKAFRQTKPYGHANTKCVWLS